MIHDAWYMIHDTWYMMHDTWYMTHDTWYMIHDTWYMIHDTWLQAETPGVTHFGAYHRPPDGHFYCHCHCFCICHCHCHCLFFVRSCLLITLITCLKGLKSLRVLFGCVFQKWQWLSQWVSESVSEWVSDKGTYRAVRWQLKTAAKMWENNVV